MSTISDAVNDILEAEAAAANPNAGSFGVQNDTDFIEAVETDAKAQTATAPVTLPTGRPANLSQMRTTMVTSAEHNMRQRPNETAERVAVVRKGAYMRIWDSPINTSEDPKMRPWKYASLLVLENGKLIDLSEGWVMSRSMTFQDMSEAAIVAALTPPPVVTDPPVKPDDPPAPPPVDPPFLEMSIETLRLLAKHHLAVAAAKDSVSAALMVQANALIALATAEKISADEHRRLSKEYETAAAFRPANQSAAQAASTEEVQQ